MWEREVLRGERKTGGKREGRERRKEKWSHATKLQKGDYRWQDDSQRICYSCPLSDFVEHLEVTLLLDAVYPNWNSYLKVCDHSFCHLGSRFCQR